MTTPTSDADLRFLITNLVKLFLVWIPIVVGIVHQFLMFFFGIEGIYVVLEPPGTIYPFVTLEFGWWLVLTSATAIVGALAYFNRIHPHRLFYPFYIYLIYLLILVKPI